jgi:hypothetical protein
LIGQPIASCRHCCVGLANQIVSAKRKGMALSKALPFALQTIEDGVFKGKQFRHTNEVPRRSSVIDWIMAITGKGADYAGQILRRIISAHPTVRAFLHDLQFEGERQKLTPVATATGLLAILDKLPRNMYMPAAVAHMRMTNGVYIEVDGEERKPVMYLQVVFIYINYLLCTSWSLSLSLSVDSFGGFLSGTHGVDLDVKIEIRQEGRGRKCVGCISSNTKHAAHDDGAYAQ